MNNDDEALSAIYKKIEREKALINAANAMKQQTNNSAVHSKLDNQIKDGRRNISFFEDRMRELQSRKLTQGMDNMHLGSSSGQSGRPTSGSRNDSMGGPPPPPKDSRGNYITEGGTDRGDYGTGGYSTNFETGATGDMMPPRPPYGPPPGAGIPKPRPNFTKLDLIKYDNPNLGPRIQLMLSQLAFKLDVEKQYLKGIEKMVQLYGMEGDKKSKADAAARLKESDQKIHLLQRAKKRYEDLHIDMDSQDAHDGQLIMSKSTGPLLT